MFSRKLTDPCPDSLRPFIQAAMVAVVCAVLGTAVSRAGDAVNPGYDSLPEVDGQVTEPLRERQVYHLLKPADENDPGFAGDRQHGRAGETARPIRAKVINQRSEPVAGIPVIFEVVDYPPGGRDFRIDRNMVPTDSSGMATIYFRAGSAGGEYRIIARIRSVAGEDMQFYTVFARERNWLMIMIGGLVGGLALFLLGMDIMSKGMLRSAGDRMRSILGSLTNNRLKALGLGAFVTMVIQSSSATNVMLVSFVNAGLMQFRQTIGVIMGAAVGTTITAQIIAFRLTDLSLIFLALGFALQTFSGKEQLKHTGSILLGFGMLFFGMDIMSEAMFPLRTYDPFLQMLMKLENPLTGILAGMVFTALIQSSSAFVGIMIILATQGLLSLEASIPLLFGSNIGTAVTSLLAGIKANREARKVALAVTVFKVFGVLMFIWWIEPFAGFIMQLSTAAGAGAESISPSLPRQIANAHTVYNVAAALIALPFAGIIALAVDRLLPDRGKGDRNVLRTSFLDESVLGTPVMALSLAKQEVLNMAGIVYEMVESVLPVFLEKDRSVLRDIELKEEKVNFLRDRINAYLLKITRSRIREERVNEAFKMLYTVKELELIADVVSSQLSRKGRSWLDAGYSFSAEGKEELAGYHEKTLKQIRRAMEVFSDENPERARLVENKNNEYHGMAVQYEKQHYGRLKLENRDTVMSSKTHLEVLAMLVNISSHAVNIARILARWKEGRSQSRELKE